MKMKRMRLVLFDIDGTLIERIGSVHSRIRVLQAVKDAYGIDIPQDFDVGLLGLIAVQIAKAWGLLVIGTDINQKRLELAI